MLQPRVPILQGISLTSGQSSSVSFSNTMGRLDIQNLGSSKIYFSLNSSIGTTNGSGMAALPAGGSWNKENLGYRFVTVYAPAAAAEVNLISFQNSGDASD